MNNRAVAAPVIYYTWIGSANVCACVWIISNAFFSYTFDLCRCHFGFLLYIFSRSHSTLVIVNYDIERNRRKKKPNGFNSTKKRFRFKPRQSLTNESRAQHGRNNSGYGWAETNAHDSPLSFLNAETVVMNHVLHNTESIDEIPTNWKTRKTTVFFSRWFTDLETFFCVWMSHFVFVNRVVRLFSWYLLFFRRPFPVCINIFLLFLKIVLIWWHKLEKLHKCTPNNFIVRSFTFNQREKMPFYHCHYHASLAIIHVFPLRVCVVAGFFLRHRHTHIMCNWFVVIECRKAILKKAIRCSACIWIAIGKCANAYVQGVYNSITFSRHREDTENEQRLKPQQQQHRQQIDTQWNSF